MDDPERAGETFGPNSLVAELSAALAASRAREQELTHELQRRVRNLLAVIRSVYRRTRETRAGQDEFADHFHDRLEAIARFHSYPPGGIELEAMVRDELMRVTWADGPDCSIKGPPVRLPPRTAELMMLALHELTTNAIKFGALAEGGRLSVRWSVDGEASGPPLRFSWTETGGRAVPAAPTTGFGRELIEEALPYQLGAETSFDLRPGGLACVIVLPLETPVVGR